MVTPNSSRWYGLASILGGLLFGLTLAGMWLTDYMKIHDVMHALGFLPGLPFLAALFGLHRLHGGRVGPVGAGAFLLTALSIAVFSVGNFAYALFDALLDIEPIAYAIEPIVFMSLYVLSLGSALIAVTLARTNGAWRGGAFLLALGAAVLFVSPEVAQAAQLAREPLALRSVLVLGTLLGPFCAAWVWLGYTMIAHRSETWAGAAPRA
jgi:hypothetical protein